MIFLFFLLILVISVYLFMQQPKFGRLPKGERLKKVKASPNYREGQFQNQSFTPDLSEDSNYYILLKDFFFTKFPRIKPIDTIPSVKTDLHNLSSAENVFVWFGHSSYFIQVDEKKILVDPVFSGGASPLSFTTRAFQGTDPYTPDDIPDIDYLFISHDHWDHIDYKTLLELKPRIGKILCGLGIGEHFEYWGFDPEKIIERDWNEEVLNEDGFEVTTAPARHFSGRGFRRNQALWISFLLQTPTMKIYIGGDSGYDSHFEEIGEKFENIDLAILENGQYDKSWKYIHMFPDEVIKAANDLKAKRFIPIHSAKFPLANHPWDEPLNQVSALHSDTGSKLITPMIGEKIDLNDPNQKSSRWWEGVE